MTLWVTMPADRGSPGVPRRGLFRGIRDPVATAAFTVRFEMPLDGGSIDRIRNFGEALALRMRRQHFGDVSNVDTAIDQLSVTLRSPHHLGEVRKLIRKTLAKHRLDSNAVVVAM